MKLDQSLEAILFHQGVPLSRKRLRELLKCDAAALDTAIEELESRLSNGGLRLVKKDDELMLGTAPEQSALIEQMTKEELSKDLSKAALETLSVVLYKGPITRGEIDHIRGVNSTFILRNLLVRGLVEKIENPTDQRSFLYRPSFDLLQTLGVTEVSGMPGYDEAIAKLASFEVEGHDPETPKESTINEGAASERTSDEHAEAESTHGYSTDDLSSITDEELDAEADQTEEDEVGEGYLDDEVRERNTETTSTEQHTP